MHAPEKHWRKISKGEVNELPLQRYNGQTCLVETEAIQQSALDALSKESILGFDTETRPTFKKGIQPTPSLIQLAGKDSVYIFQLNKIQFSKRLRDILSDPRIIKTGVAVGDDIKGLQRLTHFEAAGFVDLGDVARNLKIQTNGLRNMAANFLEFRISKGEQCSNWSREELTGKQITYAATDAWVSRKLHLAFQELGLLEQAAVMTG